jgi:hypothetical protein
VPPWLSIRKRMPTRPCWVGFFSTFDQTPPRRLPRPGPPCLHCASRTVTWLGGVHFRCWSGLPGPPETPPARIVVQRHRRNVCVDRDRQQVAGLGAEGLRPHAGPAGSGGRSQVLDDPAFQRDDLVQQGVDVLDAPNMSGLGLCLGLTLLRLRAMVSLAAASRPPSSSCSSRARWTFRPHGCFPGRTRVCAIQGFSGHFAFRRCW